MLKHNISVSTKKIYPATVDKLHLHTYFSSLAVVVSVDKLRLIVDGCCYLIEVQEICYFERFLTEEEPCEDWLSFKELLTYL